MLPGAGSIRVGVAGWEYPDWGGVVYPFRPGPRFDRLAYLARFVDVLEINTSFYRPVDPRTAEGWTRRVSGRAGFRFTAKAHRTWTHDPEAEPRKVVPPTLRGLLPLRDAGLLGALLVQFPQSFHRNQDAFEKLSRLLEGLEEWPLVVEFRHGSWDDDRSAEWLRERAVGWCVVDQPILGSSLARPHGRATSSVGYLRLHGRNARDWFRDGAGRDARYDYLYSEEELRPLAEVARTIAQQTAEVFVVQNNHFRGKAVANALLWKRLMENSRPPAPATLVAEYPALAEFVAAEPVPGLLF